MGAEARPFCQYGSVAAIALDRSKPDDALGIGGDAGEAGAGENGALQRTFPLPSLIDNFHQSSLPQPGHQAPGLLEAHGVPKQVEHRT